MQEYSSIKNNVTNNDILSKWDRVPLGKSANILAGTTVPYHLTGRAPTHYPLAKRPMNILV